MKNKYLLENINCNVEFIEISNNGKISRFYKVPSFANFELGNKQKTIMQSNIKEIIPLLNTNI